MKVVILAGGIGSRLSEETTLRPKPMVEVGGNNWMSNIGLNVVIDHTCVPEWTYACLGVLYLTVRDAIAGMCLCTDVRELWLKAIADTQRKFNDTPCRCQKPPGAIVENAVSVSRERSVY